MMKPKINTIIIPDVHGRTFWKDAIPYVEAGVPCIFLGDYVDPYDDEGISGLDALKNLREIIAFGHQHKDHVTMLLGNHDLSYLGDPWGLWTVHSDQFCYEWADVLSELFNENAENYSLCAYWEVGGKQFLFSHAGMHPVWIDWCGLFDDVDKSNAKKLETKVNELYWESLKTGERTEFMNALAMVGATRGGNSFAGSMVWADICEYNNVKENFTQIFGHTSQRNPVNGEWAEPCIVGNNICVDCGRCFYLDDEGQLHYLDDNRRVTEGWHLPHNN